MKYLIVVALLLLPAAGCIRQHQTQAVESEYTVTISGHVANPGKYRWYPEMTVSNLIDKAGGITARNIIIHIHTNSYGLWNAQPLTLRPGQTVYIAHPFVEPGGAMIMEHRIGEQGVPDYRRQSAPQPEP